MKKKKPVDGKRKPLSMLKIQTLENRRLKAELAHLAPNFASQTTADAINHELEHGGERAEAERHEEWEDDQVRGAADDQLYVRETYSEDDDDDDEEVPPTEQSSYADESEDSENDSETTRMPYGHASATRVVQGGARPLLGAAHLQAEQSAWDVGVQ